MVSIRLEYRAFGAFCYFTMIETPLAPVLVRYGGKIEMYEMLIAQYS